MLGNLFGQRKYVQSPYKNDMESTTTPAPVNEAASVSETVAGSPMEPKVRQALSILTHLDTRTTQVLTQAELETKRIKQPLIEQLQLLYGLTFDNDSFQLLSQLSVDVSRLASEIKTREQEGTFTGQPTLGSDATNIFEHAYTIARERGASFISPEDLLLAMLATGGQAAELLKAHGVKQEVLEEKLTPSFAPKAVKKSLIDRYGIDLTEKAREGMLDPIAGRDDEVERLVHILLRRTKNNPVIIGEAGVGKTAIVEGLVQKIVAGDIPADLLQKRIVQLDVASLVAGASHRGEFEERLRSVITEVMAQSGQLILFIDEIHGLIGAGGEGALDASNIIKPHLARGHIQLIGTTTTADYRKYFEKDKSFSRRFQPILAEEPDEEEAVSMLSVLKPKYEKFHNVVISNEALQASVRLSKKYIGERFLPDKAIDLLDEASAEVKLQVTSGKRQGNTVSKSDIEKVVSSWTGIPITKLTEDESTKLLNLDKLIHKRLIDQEEAVLAVSEAVRRGRIGLGAANRPIASFIFLGPTGVGKTELAKTLGEILFGREDALVRLDMSEYMEKHEVAKLIGAPPGYVGYEEGGQLTEAVRAKPYSIVLLDEVEKAHPDVFNILLQLLEDGRLTDNKGNTISFKNTIIIATSNIGSALIQQQLQKRSDEKDAAETFEELRKLLIDELHKFFKPELLNRFDEVVVFKPLAASHMLEIARLGIELTGKLLKDQGFTLEISEQALSQLAKDGYDPIYGARPLRRLIQSAIENPIAMLIISKTFVANDTIMIDYDAQKSEFTFQKATQAENDAGSTTRASTQANESKPPLNPTIVLTAPPAAIPKPPTDGIVHASSHT